MADWLTAMVGVAGILGTLAGGGLSRRHDGRQREAARREERRRERTDLYVELIAAANQAYSLTDLHDYEWARQPLPAGPDWASLVARVEAMASTEVRGQFVCLVGAERSVRHFVKLATEKGRELDDVEWLRAELEGLTDGRAAERRAELDELLPELKERVAYYCDAADGQRELFREARLGLRAAIRAESDG